jgi:hypothetical protein
MDRPVDVDSAGWLMQVHASNAALPQRNDIDCCSGESQSGDRHGQLDFFKAIGREDSDSPASESLSHGHPVMREGLG